MIYGGDAMKKNDEIRELWAILKNDLTGLISLIIGISVGIFAWLLLN